MAKARDRHGEAVVQDLEVGRRQILDVTAVAADDRDVDQHDVGAAAKGRRARRLRLREKQGECECCRAHGDRPSVSVGQALR